MSLIKGSVSQFPVMAGKNESVSMVIERSTSSVLIKELHVPDKTLHVLVSEQRGS
jgi:hypothetical protein